MLPNVTPTSPAMTAMSAGDRLRKSRTDASVDRKSTRLNSSHDQISYAVFCLKKKNVHFRRQSDFKRSCVPQPRNLHALHRWIMGHLLGGASRLDRLCGDLHQRARPDQPMSV